MDRKLVAWARAVKARRPHSARPALFLFLDDRLVDPAAAVGALVSMPDAHRWLAVVLRARDQVRRRALARAVGPICRGARVPLLVAGDRPLARRLGLGEHMPDRRADTPIVPPPGRRLHTAAAHGVRSLRRPGPAAIRFVSPFGPTASHPDARPLGPHRLARIAARAPRAVMVAALGGIDGRTVRRLPPTVRTVGAVGALVAPAGAPAGVPVAASVAGPLVGPLVGS